MNSPLSRLVTRAAYALSQLPRVAWYVGHGLAMGRLSERARRREGKSTRPRAHTDAAVPDRNRLCDDMPAWLQRDLANCAPAISPLPTDHDGSLSTLLEMTRLFFEPLPDIHSEIESGVACEVLTAKI